jgi:hypothetical protein
MEADNISCNTAVSNAIWIIRFIESLNLGITNRPANVFCDNKFFISLLSIYVLILISHLHICQINDAYRGPKWNLTGNFYL